MRYRLLFSLLLLAYPLYAQVSPLPLPSSSESPPLLPSLPQHRLPTSRNTPTAWLDTLRFFTCPEVEPSGIDHLALPRVTSALTLPSHRPLGLTVIMGTGYGFGQGYGLGGSLRIGYTFPFGLYLGTIGLFSLGTPNPDVLPRPAFGQLANHFSGVELGFEVPVALLGGTFAHRVYVGTGSLWSNLSAIAPTIVGIDFVSDPWQWYRGFNPVLGTRCSIQPNAAYFQHQILFLSIGSLFYYKMPPMSFLRNLLVGLDARYLFVGNLSGFLAIPTIGVYF